MTFPKFSVTLTKLAAAASAAMALAPAHATIGVGTYANCDFDGTTKYNNSWTGQQPYLAEWSFSLSQTNYTAAGVQTTQGQTFYPGYVVANTFYPVGYPVYQAVGNHFGADGHAYYAVTTVASTCAGDVRSYQEPPHLALGATTQAAGSAATQATGSTAVAGAAAAAAPAPGVRIDATASVMPLAQYQQQQRTWSLMAPRATADGVAAMLADTKHPSFERALAAHRERLTFSPARTGNTELAKLAPAKSLPAGNSSDAGWSGYTRIYRTADGWVMLEELDLQALQASVVIMRESINADVNGSPALLRSASAQGTNLTALTWIANGKRYALKTNAAPAQAGERLLAIARGLY